MFGTFTELFQEQREVLESDLIAWYHALKQHYKAIFVSEFFRAVIDHSPGGIRKTAKERGYPKSLMVTLLSFRDMYELLHSETLNSWEPARRTVYKAILSFFPFVSANSVKDTVDIGPLGQSLKTGLGSIAQGLDKISKSKAVCNSSYPCRQTKQKPCSRKKGGHKDPPSGKQNGKTRGSRKVDVQALERPKSVPKKVHSQEVLEARAAYMRQSRRVVRISKTLPQGQALPDDHPEVAELQRLRACSFRALDKERETNSQLKVETSVPGSKTPVKTDI